MDICSTCLNHGHNSTSCGSKSSKTSVLLEAHEIVSKRNDAYGEPTDTAERVSTAFSVLTGREITPADVALIQMLFKIVRSEHGYKRDHNVDLAGYTDIRERCFLKALSDKR